MDMASHFRFQESDLDDVTLSQQIQMQAAQQRIEEVLNKTLRIGNK